MHIHTESVYPSWYDIQESQEIDDFLYTERTSDVQQLKPGICDELIPKETEINYNKTSIQCQLLSIESRTTAACIIYFILYTNRTAVHQIISLGETINF